MQLTAELKPISELKSLPTFENEFKGHLGFKDNVNITPNMLSKTTITLTYNKDWKSFSDGKYEYSLDWLTNITVSDDKLKLSLEVNELTLTVRILEMDESLRENGNYKSIKGKNRPYNFLLYSHFKLKIYEKSLDFNGTYADSSTYTFESHKALTKWIIRLIKCK